MRERGERERDRKGGKEKEIEGKREGGRERGKEGETETVD